jgi:type II restriction/modification system DNA methylase subunit YeeA
MSRQILQDIINDFQVDKFTRFFRSKSDKFYPQSEILPYADDNFYNGKKLGEINFEDGNLIVCSFQVKQSLSDRSGKKAQYELGKKILKTLEYDAGIFIFYDEQGNFRFSLIYANYLGRRRNWSSFRRFTYFVSKDFTNKTFLQRIGDSDFSSLAKIKEAFSVEPLQKEFYIEIQKWFFGTIDKVYFPDSSKKEIPLHLIRLLSRLIFVWFIKQMGLIPNEIFDEKRLKNIVKDFGKLDNYYNAILQNLFFATLNQPKDKRGWAFNKKLYENISTFGIKQLYRYEDKFLIKPNEILEIFSKIPFINGGLFDCLDRNDAGGKIVDGFSRDKKNQAKIPDFVFFAESFPVNLSSFKIKANQARGLIKILESYNFTIDEATPIDQEIALDPELLGKIFENLLAEYNEDTQITARKATGSYYTPRDIVEYMVHQSLFEYFKNKLTKIPEEKIDMFLSYNNDEFINFSNKEREEIVKCISDIKIIDPACGSGAFLIGVLNKLVHILNKVDPDNYYWKKLQEEKIREEIKFIAEKAEEKEISEHLKEVSRVFDENLNYPDYARKLYIIENCIYGVDIQQIAVQLSKLRFFISLIIDQKVDIKKENCGIIPLPNLDIKFIAANSLIGIKEFNSINNYLLEDKEVRNLLEKIKEKNHYYFRAKTRSQKLKIQNSIKEFQLKLADIIYLSLKDKEIKELNELQEKSEQIQNEIEKIKLEPEQIEVFNQKDLFGGIHQIKIDYKKDKIKNKIKELKENQKRIQLTEKLIKGDELNQIAQKIASFNPFDQNYSHDWFDPEWMFEIKEGFDIVIANPPYIQLQKALDNKRKYADLYKDAGYETFERTGDIYCLFYERGIQLLKEKGILTYISSNKWMRAGYGEKLRAFFLKYNPKLLINLGERIFENVTVDTNILIVQKCPNENKLKAVEIKEKKKRGLDLNLILQEKGVVISNLNQDAWFIGSEAEQKLKEKIEKIGKPLKEWDINIYYGIKTGLNEAFIISTEKRNEILANCKTEEERKRTESIIKPILRGRDIKRYYYEWTGLWVIGTFPALHLNIDDYPAIKKYFLDNFDIRQLEQSGKKYPKLGFNARKKTGNKWFETQDQIAYYPEFEKEKVVWNRITDVIFFSFVDKNYFVLDSTFFITGNDLKYLIGVLNSIVSKKWIKMSAATLGEGSYGAKIYIENLPIPLITEENEWIAKKIEALVDKIIIAKKQNKNADTSYYEKQIDQLVYKLYNLTEEEIKIIEENG